MSLVRIAAGILVSGLLFVPGRASLSTNDVYALRSNIKIGVGSNPHATAIDGTANRAFVATARGLFLVDLERQRVLGQVASFPNVRALALTADRRRIAAALADGHVAIVHITPRNVTRVRTNLTSLGLMALDPASNTIFAVAHSGRTVAIVNVDTGKLESSIAIDGAVDSLTAAGGRAFVLLSDNRVQVIDAVQRQVVATWSAGKLADGPPVLAVDDTGDRLFVGADTEILMMASATGNVLGRVNAPSRVRSIGYDAKRSLMVSTSYREGLPSTLTVASTTTPAAIRLVEQIELPAGAGGLHIDSSTGVFAVTASDITLRDATPAILSPRPVLKQPGPAPGHFLLLIYRHAGD